MHVKGAIGRDVFREYILLSVSNKAFGLSRLQLFLTKCT